MVFLNLALTGFVTSCVFALWHWQPISGSDAWLLIGICVTSIASHLLLIKALTLAAAAVLQPFNYLILVWAIIFAYLVYGEVLSTLQLAGALLVTASGVYVGWREYVATRRLSS